MRSLTEMTAAEIETELNQTGVEVGPLHCVDDGELLGAVYGWPALKNLRVSFKEGYYTLAEQQRRALWIYREQMGRLNAGG